MSGNSSLWYFENVDLYNLMCPTKSPDLENRHQPNVYQKEDVIYFQQDRSSHIYMISEGRVKIGGYTSDGKELVKAILGKGELFGEMALTGEERRSDFAKALDNGTRVCTMSLEDMNSLIKEDDTLSFKILKLIGFRLKKVERRLESLVFKDARTRIIEFLKELADERGQKVGYETMIKNHFTHKDIASLTGTSRQTVTTIMNELKEKNLINFDRRRILIRDMERLMEEMTVS